MGNVTRVRTIKIRYLGDAEEPIDFVGVATKNVYTFGGKINLGEVDVRDLAIGRSTHPGLFELTNDKGQKLFEMHVPLKEEVETARAMKQKAWEDAEAIALPEEADGESTVPGD